MRINDKIEEQNNHYVYISSTEWEKVQKKTKALDSFKSEIRAVKYGEKFILFTIGGSFIKELSQEEFDLLKEVLL